MSDLRPLLEEDATSIEADILRQARAREPSAGAAGRALVALGIAGAATTATAGAAAAPAALLIVKWVGVGALSAAMLIGGGEVARVVSTRSSVSVPSGHSEASKPQPPAFIASPAAAVVPAPSATVEAVEMLPGVTEAPTALAPRSIKPAGRSPVVAQGGEPATPAVLDAEIALLDAARDAIAAHDPARALRLLDDHRQQFPNGQLLQEATYVRVKALLERGSRAEAERAARQFLESHPESPHAKRIRALFEQ
jgi:TolA-binding protein